MFSRCVLAETTFCPTFLSLLHAPHCGSVTFFTEKFYGAFGTMPTLRLRWARGPDVPNGPPGPAGSGRRRTRHHDRRPAGAGAGRGPSAGRGPAQPASGERDRVVAEPGRYADAAGRMHPGSSWRGLLTRGPTACASSRSSGAGSSATSPPESHASDASDGSARLASQPI